MRQATICLFIALIAGAWSASAQETEYLFDVPVTEEFKAPYSVGIHSGARGVAGPVDLDSDGQQEVLVTDYTGGGRVHVIENVGVDTWEWAYSTPWLDSTATTSNARTAAGGDLDNDGMGEIYVFAGQGYSETSSYSPGLFVFEFNGTDFGDEPATVYQFPTDTPDRFVTERLELMDVDGDQQEELLFGNNGSDNRYDEWIILSVTGDIGGGFEVWTEELRLTTRSTEDVDPVDRGGGSGVYIGAGDFDGDGATDMSLHSWNSFNLTTARAVAPNTYAYPDEGDENAWIHVTDYDGVALFGGTVVDVDQDGNDEVFYTVYDGGESVLVNYEEGENTLEITEDNVVLNIFGEEPFSTLGIGSGDLDGDGNMEVFATGPAYSGELRTAGELPAFVRVAEYQGGDVESPASYTVEDLNFFEPFDTTDAFDVVERDSAGVDSTYYEPGDQGAEFVSKFAYLGDVDGDDFNELAVAFQGIDDSTFTINETYNAQSNIFEREFVDSEAREQRIFMRVIQGTGLSVKVVDEQIIMPGDYKLSENYPNPFNPSTSFTFTLPVDKAVSVKIYDITGREVKTLLNSDFRTAGTYEVTWDGTNNAGQAVASGTYVYSLEWGQFRQSKTMVLLK